MNHTDRRRIALVGIDGFSPVYMDELIRDERLPSLSKLVRSGVRVPLVSTLPATTPVAWATIATGAPPSVTGIEGFMLHRPGDRLDRRISGCYAYRCRAEPIWETATAAGKRSYVVKFPLSYPSETASFRLDGAAGWGGLKCFHEAASTAVVDNLDRGGICADTEQWLAEDHGSGTVRWRGRWAVPTLWNGGPVSIYVLLVEVDGAPVLELALERDRSRLLVSLQRGQWSDALTLLAPGRRGPAECSFRVKFLDGSIESSSIRLFHTALHERSGHSTPASLWDRYLPVVGPIEEQTEPSLVFNQGLDLTTQLEIFRLNTEWLRRISVELLIHERWDLFMVQIHLVDWAHHLLHGAIDPRHPLFDPSTSARYEEALFECYRLADSLVGAVASVLPHDADLVVLGDHGQDLQHTTLRLNEWLASEGLLRWIGDGDEVDWSHTAAYATGNYIHFNLRGREPTGRVAPSELEALRERVVDRLLSLTDPATGSRPVLIAGSKREFERLGADGAGVGDVVLCLRSGYQATNSRGAVFSRTVPLQEFTSGHDHFWPLDPRIHTRLFAAGPHFRRGYSHGRAAHLVDVAPTLSAVLGIRPPKHAEGRVLTEILEGEPEQSSREAPPTMEQLLAGL